MDNSEFGHDTGGMRHSPDDSAKPPSFWWCIFCEKQNRWQDYECRDCERPRYYQLTQLQARSVARKLNRLETENKGLSAMLAASTLYVARLGRQLSQAEDDRNRAFMELGRLRKVQPCGHEARFIVYGSDRDIDPEGKGLATAWCALCALQAGQRQCTDLRKALDQVDKILCRRPWTPERDAEAQHVIATALGEWEATDETD